jgi:hypothetical protein
MLEYIRAKKLVQVPRERPGSHLCRCLASVLGQPSLKIARPGTLCLRHLPGGRRVVIAAAFLIIVERLTPEYGEAELDLVAQAGHFGLQYGRVLGEDAHHRVCIG